MSKRYPPVIPSRLEGFTRTPGRDRAPVPELPPARKKRPGEGAGNEGFPPGIYAALDRIEDLYIVQSERPVKVFLAYGPQTAPRLLAGSGPPLPFSPGELVIDLDPYFPEARDRGLGEDIRRLLDRGYSRFVINNPGHLSFFRNAPCSLIAGPYLYIFNRWAASFAAGEGLDYFVSPLENNRQNLERTVDPRRRSLVFITVFARPALFRIRANLGGLYRFGEFSGGMDERFRLVHGPGGSRVYPETPFSITDKIPFLRKAGFDRFVVDFSGTALKKGTYKDIMRAVKDALPLPGAGRFNWKNGFFQNPEPGAGKNGGDGRGRGSAPDPAGDF
jgi:putative protease